MYVQTRIKSLLLLPMLLLVIGTFVTRMFAPHHDAAGAPDYVVSIGDHVESNAEQAALAELVSHLSHDPTHSIRVVWYEDPGGYGRGERSATYLPQEQRLVDNDLGQITIQEGVTLAGMSHALRSGDRGANFSAARVASLHLSLPHQDTVPVAESFGFGPHADNSNF